jgi:release factor H-coupled RctB family protein
MPSNLTVILNSNHSRKFACLLQSLQAPKQIILREARNKFRIKNLSQVYIQGGVELEEEIDLKEGATTVWVSKGEPYSGPPLQNGRSDGAADVRIIAEQSYVDEKAIKQLKQLADLEGVRLVVGMPDLHPGSRFPIGCAIAADGVYPALIGSDVGCGIALYQIASPSTSHPPPSKLANLLRGLDEPWSGPIIDWLASYGIHRTSEFDNDSLGTVGAGNHFAEICQVERLVDEDAAERLGVHEDALYLLGTCRGKH